MNGKIFLAALLASAMVSNASAEIYEQRVMVLYSTEAALVTLEIDDQRAGCVKSASFEIISDPDAARNFARENIIVVYDQTWEAGANPNPADAALVKVNILRHEMNLNSTGEERIPVARPCSSLPADLSRVPAA